MLKKLKIGPKLFLCFILVALISSVSGVVCLVFMRNIDTNYSYALTNYGFAQGDIGRAISSFLAADGALHDVISYQSQENSDRMRSKYNTYIADAEKYFQICNETVVTEDGARLYADMMSAWADYKVLASELLEIGGNTTDPVIIARVQQRLVDELDPYYDQVYTDAMEMLDVKISTGDDLSDDMTRSAAFSMILAVVLILAALAIAVVFSFLIARSISVPIRNCASRLTALSQGDIHTPSPHVDTEDESGQLADATETIVSSLKEIISDIDYQLDAMAAGDFTAASQAKHAYAGDYAPILASLEHIRGSLSTTLNQINESSDQVASGSDQVASGAQALSQGATEQASSVEELAATINEISTKINENAEHARDASTKAIQMGQDLDSSNHQMEQMLDAMTNISNTSSEINKIIKNIEDIAFQTNILALNAAVEAARAGSAGKGFAVVADEVRNLAGKSAEAAKNTTSLIESSLEAVENGTTIANATAESLKLVVGNSKEVVQIVDSISEASTEQANAVSQVTQGIDQISSVVQTNSATAEQSAAASQELSGQAQLLKELIGKFKLHRGGNVSSHAPAASAYQSSSHGTHASEAPIRSSMDKY